MAVVVLGVFPVTIALRAIARGVTGAVIVAGLGRFRTFGGKPGDADILRRPRFSSEARHSDPKRSGRRGKMDDHICSMGNFRSVRYAHASHTKVPEIRIDFLFLLGVEMCRALVQKQDLWSAIERARKQYSL